VVKLSESFSFTQFEAVNGLEVHDQIKTRLKMFTRRSLLRPEPLNF